MLLEGEALKDRGHAVHQVRKLFNVGVVGNVVVNVNVAQISNFGSGIIVLK